MKIAIAQIDPIVGDFEHNISLITEAYERACSQQARLLLTPELSVCGYPPYDLLLRPEMLERCDRALERLVKITQGKTTALVVGHVAKNKRQQGLPTENAVSVLENGHIVFSQSKTLLPTYDVFDESRYFEPAQATQVWSCEGIKIIFAVCEDLWAKDLGAKDLGTHKRERYAHDPVERYRGLDPDLLISISASPYEWNKRQRREAIHLNLSHELDCPLIYVNQVGATDEILFDGGSFVCQKNAAQSGESSLMVRAPLFKEFFATVCIGLDPQQHRAKVVDDLQSTWNLTRSYGLASDVFKKFQEPEEIDVLIQGLIRGIQDYFAKTGFSKAILGLSGGIDSAVVAALGVLALGRENVYGVAMPGPFSSGHALEDAEETARLLGLRFDVKPIKFTYQQLSRDLSSHAFSNDSTLKSLTLENLQARLRGLTLMTLSNELNALVFTTGNKSELATGYCTLYGDMVGALAPLGDCTKTRVYQIARRLNQSFYWDQGKFMTDLMLESLDSRSSKEIAEKEILTLVPARSIDKPPSAELRPDQKDQDTLPPYDQLDQCLEAYLEHSESLEVLEQRFGTWVRPILKRLEMNEYKRRQSAPILKVTTKAFGIGRRIPLAKRWE